MLFNTSTNNENDVFNKEWILTHFENSLEEGRFHIYLQPQVDMNGNILGAEVLTRWTEDENLSVPVGDFIPVLIDAELITKMDLYIWELAIRQLALWHGTPLENLHLSVNVEPKDIISINVPDKIKELCETYKVDINKIHVEITERGFDTAFMLPEEIIESFHKNGIIVEIDDFGNGSNTLSLLKDLDADVLKIDRNFVKSTTQSIRGQIILETIVGLANSLQTQLIVEGVETEEQKASVLKAGCNIYQGFLFSKPVPIKSFENLYNKHQQKQS